MAVSGIKQHIILDIAPPTPPTPGVPWITGNTKAARHIRTETVYIDYILTSIHVNITSAVGTTTLHPGIIRVYQDTREDYGVKANVNGVVKFTQAIWLPIRLSYGSPRKIVVDAFDDSAPTPNNLCSLKGTIVIKGRPALQIEQPPLEEV